MLPLINRRVQFDVGVDQKTTQMRLTSTSNAFEFDDIIIRSVVPEPQSRALMIAGFGLVGAAAGQVAADSYLRRWAPACAAV